MKMYGIERWDSVKRTWMPCRFELEDLDEVHEIIDLLETAMPDAEFRPAQYKLTERVHITF